MSPTSPPEPVSTARAASFVVLGAAALAAVWFLGLRGVEPVATWFYPFAWYPLLVALEGLHALTTGRFFVADRPVAVASLLLWSVPIWILYELLNLRLENWYYVFVPERRVVAWSGIVISFATVLPAVVLPAALVARWLGWGGEPGTGSEAEAVAPSGEQSAWDVGVKVGGPGPDEGGRQPGAFVRWAPPLGAACLLLPMAWPRWFFPLVWVALLLLVDPVVARRDPDRSLLAELASGRWRRTGSILLGGALAGLFWEALNTGARSRWIYTVPGLEELKLFEMPPLGFLGFPVFALSAWALYQWLVLHGVAEPVEIPGGPSAERREAAAPDHGSADGAHAPGRLAAWAAPVVVIVGLLGMEARTISSTTPRLRDLPGLMPSEVEDLTVWGVEDPFALAGLEPGELVAQVPGVDDDEARRWIESARLATLRGIGTRWARRLHRVGVTGVEELAGASAHELGECLAAAGAPDAERARVRVWIRAARTRHPEATPGTTGLSCS